MNRLRFSAFATEYDLRLAIIDAGRITYERGLVSAYEGNISARLGDEMIVMTPERLCKGRLDLEDLLVLNLEGQVLKSDPKRHLTLPSDLSLYLEIYRARPDVRAIIHAHPRFEAALALQAKPKASQAEIVKTVLTSQNYVIVPGPFGWIAAGEHLEDALMTLEQHEHHAEVEFYARLLSKSK